MIVRVRDTEAERRAGPDADPVIVSLDVGERCPWCGGPRGQLLPITLWGHAGRFTFDVWTNPCLHIETLPDLRREAGTREARQRQNR